MACCETQLVVGGSRRADSIQHAALGTALNSTGWRRDAGAGFFGGTLDEARIWNYARSASEVLDGKNQDIPAATGLLGRWSFNEPCGPVTDLSGNGQHGTLLGSGCTWVPGVPR